MSSHAAPIYVVDDDASAREAIVEVVRSDGFRAVAFASALEFLAHRRLDPAGCLVLDVDMPELSGLDLQRRLNAAQDTLPIIFVTGHGDVPMCASAIKAGAVDFLTKPFDAEALLDSIRRAIASDALHERRSRGGRGPRGSDGAVAAVEPHRQGATEPAENAGIVGESSSLRAVLQQVKAVAATETTVLIQGETGTGKERIARLLHELSGRNAGPFVKLNCAAIPSGLLESELMGHERGAFTGAVTQRIGRFELAHNGSIFLDEIGELPLEMQPKLLRILQEHEFERIGGTRTLHTNARVIAATNRDLPAMVAARTFREDLYYRLCVFPVQLPPLRERMEDIPALARYFVRELATRMGKQVAAPAAATLERLAKHTWPGNIRELQNVLERAVVLSEHGVLAVPPLGAGAQTVPGSYVSTPRLMTSEADGCGLPSVPDAVVSSSQALDEISRAHILRVLEESNWIVSGPHGAAAKLRVKRSTLNFRMRKLGIARPGQRPLP